MLTEIITCFLFKICILQSQWNGRPPSATNTPCSAPASASLSASSIVTVPLATHLTFRIPCNWSEHICPDGFKYYYNCITRESRVSSISFLLILSFHSLFRLLHCFLVNHGLTSDYLFSGRNLKNMQFTSNNSRNCSSSKRLVPSRRFRHLKPTCFHRLSLHKPPNYNKHILRCRVYSSNICSNICSSCSLF